MEKLKKYDIFAEEYRLNESWLSDSFDNLLAYFKQKFAKKSWWIPLLKFLINKGAYKNKVKFFTPKNVPVPVGVEAAIKKADEEPVISDEQPIPAMSERYLNEGVGLAHPGKVRDIFPDELVDEITDIFEMKLKNPKWKPNIFIWGAPGIGKSECVREVAEELGLMRIEMNLAHFSPEDFIGIPDLVELDTKNDKGETVKVKRTKYNLPIIMPLDNGESEGFNGGILFFDEMNNATDKVLDASLSLALDGTIPSAQYQLPSKWIIVAAGNRRAEAPTTTEMGFRMNNRFKHVNLITDVKHWIKWAAGQPDIDGDLIGFLQWQEDWLHKMDTDAEEAPENWPSPRSWVRANNQYVFSKEKYGRLSRQRIINIFTDYVGPEAASTFASYLDLKDKFSYDQVKDVYENGAKAKAKIEGLRMDEAKAAIFSIAFFKKGKKVSLQEMKNVIDWAMTLKNFEDVTLLISFFRKVHPYIKTDEPFRDIYQDYLNLWHEEKYGKDFIEKVEGEGADDAAPPAKKTAKAKK